MAKVIQSLFGKPKCSDCNGIVVETGYSFPYPSYRCPNCYQRSKEKAKMKAEINELKNQLKKA